MILLEEVNELYNKFSEKVSSPNHLDLKTKALIAISCSVMADCVPCIEYNYESAVNSGASKQEIQEALAISMSVSAGSKRGKYSGMIAELQSKYKVK